MGYSPQGLIVLDMTEKTQHACTHQESLLVQTDKLERVSGFLEPHSSGWS